MTGLIRSRACVKGAGAITQCRKKRCQKPHTAAGHVSNLKNGTVSLIKTMGLRGFAKCRGSLEEAVEILKSIL